MEFFGVVVDKSIFKRLKGNSLFKDSFWAVFGNGFGYGLLLLSGILIARFLGKDLYGEYGLVKTTMFTIAAFSTFGLGYTSTKFVANYLENNKEKVHYVIKVSLSITLISSSILALLLITFAVPISKYLNEPSLKLAFQILGFITIVRALLTTLNGVLAGFKKFKIIARCNVISGIIMLVISVPMSYYFKLGGALSSLAISQIFNLLLNFIELKKILIEYPEVKDDLLYKEMLMFSFPVALQELSYSLSGWLVSLFLVKYSSLGEMGLYTASAQWDAIILFIPGLLYNVVLSHLSSTADQYEKHRKIVNRMLSVNFLSTLFPFILVVIFSDFISSFYGSTFSEMSVVLEIIVFSTIFSACSKVLQSEMISQGYMWPLFFFRIIRDFSFLILSLFFLKFYEGNEGAKYLAISGVITSILYFILLFFYTKNKIRKNV